MIEFIIGVVVGAAFAPFWMKVFSICKDMYKNFMSKPGA